MIIPGNFLNFHPFSSILHENKDYWLSTIELRVDMCVERSSSIDCSFVFSWKPGPYRVKAHIGLTETCMHACQLYYCIFACTCLFTSRDCPIQHILFVKTYSDNNIIKQARWMILDHQLMLTRRTLRLARLRIILCEHCISVIYLFLTYWPSSSIILKG